MTLHRFNGDEIFNVESATIDYYIDEGRSYATTFRADVSIPPIQSLSDTEELRAKPFVEITIQLPKVPSLMLQKGRSFSLARGYNDASGEYLTNFYYCEHELMDNIEIVVVARKLDRVQLRITGTTMDVNYYDGSKPATKVEIEAEFILSLGL